MSEYKTIESFEQIPVDNSVNGIWVHNFILSKFYVKTIEFEFDAKIMEYDPKPLFPLSENKMEYLLTILHYLEPKTKKKQDHKRKREVLFQRFKYLSWEECNKQVKCFFDNYNKSYKQEKWQYKLYRTRAESLE